MKRPKRPNEGMVNSPMRLALVYNERLAPKRMAKIQRLAQVLEARGHEVAHHFGDHFVAARDAAQADCVILGGGDGTARLVIGNQPDSASLPPFAIFPTGTINLLARELGYPRNPERFAERIERQTPPTVTRIATINGQPFLACASIGFDAHTVARVSEALKLKIGRFAYVAALLALVKDWPRHAVSIVAGDERIEAEAVFVLRGRYYAGPWTLDRQAHLAQEKLRILALPNARKRDMLLLLLYALLGSRRPHGHWRFLEADRVSIASDQTQPIQADGDVVDRAPVEIELTDAILHFR